MGLWRGYRSSGELLLLGNGKRVAANRVWALRVLVTIMLLATLTGTAAGGPQYAIGALVGCGVFYALGLSVAATSQPSTA